MRFRQFFGLAMVLLGVLSVILSACGSNEQPSGTDQSKSTTVLATVIPGILPPGNASVEQREYLPPYGCLPAITITDVVVQACMNIPEPNPKENLQITTRMSKNGVAIQKAPIKTIWNYQTGRKECATTSDKDGVGFCYQNIGGAAPGFRVVVEVQYDYNGKEYRGETSFTPKGSTGAAAPTSVAAAAATATKSQVSVKAALFPQQPTDPTPEDLSKQGNLTYQTAKCTIKGNIAMETGEKIYLVSDDRYYITTKIDPEFGERWFCNEQDAIKNGWRKTYL